MVLKLKETRQVTKDFTHQSSYIKSVKTLNVVTEFMTDDTIPYQVPNGGCIWLNEKGIIGEIEFIHPKETQPNQFNIIKKLESFIPLFELDKDEYENTSLEIKENIFLVWLKKTHSIDVSISYGDVSYLISKNILCGLIIRKVISQIN
ncbi:hypothetical protein [Saccharibacillus sp. JS10]|uniref:hypothetical protein n=1 Tax=Saccharibacillus sp. JS10 TaxID=2950552 RepID=UPI00210EBEFD|nr:hypothetical protein [Saccharibacillus sp. JS10]MCQ4087557.1 hypothetical protein [Saccharibacillus sp. JS10]